MKQYKAIPGPKILETDKGNIQSAFDSFAQIINREASNGWEYHSMETITVSEKSGCGNSQVVNTQYHMLIFVKEQ